jgi:hypothetical protein
MDYSRVKPQMERITVKIAAGKTVFGIKTEQ